MSTLSENNKRIAKNTVALYVRMCIMTLISLFTSRVILNTLGVDDYGIYNVVGGLVILFSIISSPISSSFQRYLTFELGTGNKERLKLVFSTSISIQLLLSLIIVFLCETVGLWFLNYKMSIPEGRLGAANFVLQCSLLNFVFGMLSSPYNAVIIAHERMNIYAYFSILEALLKLGIVYLVFISPFDKLKIYASLLLAVSALMQLIYILYCRKNFDESKFRINPDKSLFKEMLGFAGWSFFGNTAWMLNSQGVNMLINVFFGVKINAVRAITHSVETAVNQFMNGFTTAINPQITKSYSSGNKEYMFELISRGSKFSYIILYFILVPLILETDTILSLWLVEVPENTVLFVRLAIFASSITILGSSMLTGILATGEIRNYQIVNSLITCSVFFFTFIAYKLGAPAFITYVIFIIVYFCLVFVKLYYLRRLLHFPVRNYVFRVLCPLIAFSFISFLVPGAITFFFPANFLRLILITLLSCIWTFVTMYVFALNSSERKLVVTLITNKLKIAK